MAKPNQVSCGSPHCDSDAHQTFLFLPNQNQSKQGNQTMPSNHEKAEISTAVNYQLQSAGMPTNFAIKAHEMPLNFYPQPPRSEKQKSLEGTEGLPVEIQHERTSEQFNAAESNPHQAQNINPRNKSTFSRNLGS